MVYAIPSSLSISFCRVKLAWVKLHSIAFLIISWHFSDLHQVKDFKSVPPDGAQAGARGALEAVLGLHEPVGLRRGRQ